MAAAPSPAAHRPVPSPGRPAPHPQDGQRPELRVVGRPRHRRRYVALLSLLGALGIFGVVSLHALAAEAAFEARTLESEVSELAMRYEELTAEVAALESPERIRDVAVGELGMIPAEQPAYLALDGEVPPPAAATTSTDAVAGEGRGGVDTPLADPLKRLRSAGG